MISQGSQTMEISNSASPTATRWPIGHAITSAPLTVKFSRRCPLDIERLEVLGRDEEDRALARRACAQPSTPVLPDRRLVERLHRHAPRGRTPDADQLSHVSESSDRGLTVTLVA